MDSKSKAMKQTKRNKQYSKLVVDVRHPLAMMNFCF